MKTGYRVLIHKDIKEDHTGFLDSWIKITNEHGYGCRRKSGAHYRRNILGYTVNYSDKRDTVFRRLSTKRRIFGLMPMDNLETLDGTEIDKEQCMCAEHLGGTRVRIKGGFKESDFNLYYETGEIKG